MTPEHKKELVEKYHGLSTDKNELTQLIASDELDLSPEEIDELVAELLKPADAPPVTSPVTPAAALAKASKPRFDIIKGQWIPRQEVTIPGTGQKLVVKWEFQPDGKPVKTGIPMDQRQVDEFNASRRLRAIKNFTEQMVPEGSKEPIYDIVENPYAVKDI